jgi:tRNA G18 (ribose-2'-O)-methylase SpoU
MDSGVPVYVADQGLFDRIAGFHVHRGALALARRPASRDLGEAVEGSRLVLAVEGVNDHENLGALFRNAAAFGAGAVVLDPRTADPLYRRSVRVSVGHVLRIPFVRSGDWLGDLARLRAAGFLLVALDPGGPASLDDLVAPPSGRVALLVGAEGDGLTPAAREAADLVVRIPMAAGVDSLNVATAAAVALHRVAGVLGCLGPPGAA